ncbi:12010_t:CDS:2 [Entrophospora sp. SA101]|nr:12008_t:CDS:2 [Entrophospora sp. SA101]CAJ0838551.1 12010_t:CDS:2 [Entrophospora sp. SA101]
MLDDDKESSGESVIGEELFGVDEHAGDVGEGFDSGGDGILLFLSFVESASSIQK